MVGLGVLQTPALPLGYVALDRISLRVGTVLTPRWESITPGVDGVVVGWPASPEDDHAFPLAAG
jgi:hypothetical protein